MLSFVFIFTKLLAFNTDSTKIVRPPKHYFSNSIYIDSYSTGKLKLDTINKISKRLETFQLKQFTIGFNVPVATVDFYNKDSTKISNIHFLLSGGYTKLSLMFGGIAKHELSKTSLGFRCIYNNGKKSIFFIEVTPFITKDNGYSYTRETRLATTLLYNYAANEYFSFRVGYTRSFLWGNRFNLPYVGIRVGKLDKVNFSIQFPIVMSFSFPIGKYFRAGIYSKLQGVLYSFANTDS
ncbi:MAG: hypothetical protein H0W84_10310, partial [Bacteroidetes bacterium]|nr:hypothetical protein [Bacteroidota bacterium]